MLIGKIIDWLKNKNLQYHKNLQALDVDSSLRHMGYVREFIHMHIDEGHQCVVSLDKSSSLGEALINSAYEMHCFDDDTLYQINGVKPYDDNSYCFTFSNKD